MRSAGRAKVAGLTDAEQSEREGLLTEFPELQKHFRMKDVTAEDCLREWGGDWRNAPTYKMMQEMVDRMSDKRMMDKKNVAKKP
jgi:hypothetical protein